MGEKNEVHLNKVGNVLDIADKNPIQIAFSSPSYRLRELFITIYKIQQKNVSNN